MPPPRPLLAALACALTACTGSGPGGGPPADAGGDGSTDALAWTIRGRVTDASGAPLAGIDVDAEALRPVPQSGHTVTGPDGTYRFRLDPAKPGVWHVSASRHFVYGGTPFALRFEPTDPTEFAGNAGAVRDFVWPGLGGALGLGTGAATLATLFIDGALSSGWESERTEVTLEPLTPLLDGSAGRTIVGRPVNGPEGVGLYQVPYARYRLRARYDDPERGWVAMCVRARNDGTRPRGALSAEVDFHPVYSILTLEAELGVPRADQTCG